MSRLNSFLFCLFCRLMFLFGGEHSPQGPPAPTNTRRGVCYDVGSLRAARGMLGEEESLSNSESTDFVYI